MTADVSSSGSFKRRRLIGAVDHTASIDRTANIEENDEFYDFTPEDYYRIQRPRQQEDKLLKTQKIREAEDAKRRSTITKAVIRVRFPDNRTVEATFHPADKIQSLLDYMRKVVARPELPFCLFTAPPKQVTREMSQDFYSAGFVPGAVVHLTYGVPN
ncbi:hypothetical protein C1H46_000577 [Malus baccata]|uniref:UBX domain-containing protein n=1 Tax=Malus baccata TaxID=106549 RepID=A0A540NSC7_MALBA|nr:hypothetical protein C1H46_000577 [Malus baccata]